MDSSRPNVPHDSLDPYIFMFSYFDQYDSTLKSKTDEETVRDLHTNVGTTEYMMHCEEKDKELETVRESSELYIYKGL